MAYLNKEKTIEAIRKYADIKHSNGEPIEYVNGILKSISVISEQPSADVVEVVRCKDCARAIKLDGCCICSADNETMLPDDFCSCGERK